MQFAIPDSGAIMNAWPAGIESAVGPLWIAIIVTIGFAALARLVRGVSTSGAVAGAIVCFLLYTSAGPGAFATLVCVFMLAWITTRLGYQQKLRLGTAERREGRTASQVLANLGVATACAALYARHRNGVFLLAIAAALAEAAADTVSSELGQANSRQARLITTWEVVPAGTDGGITLAGTLAGIAAAVLVSSVGALTALISWRWVGISVAAAVIGMIADSFIGAWLERRHWLNNDAVNLVGTLIAAVIASRLA
jgi:uncharacterized protein (TIGR00297 family)